MIDLKLMAKEALDVPLTPEEFARLQGWAAPPRRTEAAEAGPSPHQEMVKASAEDKRQADEARSANQAAYDRSQSDFEQRTNERANEKEKTGEGKGHEPEH